jgi:DNA-binding NarL/FixJ family response regulator
MIPRTRILIVDDHEIVRQGLKMVLELEADFEVVGEAGSGTEAVRQVELHRPDLILLDLVMPDMSGVEVTQAIKTRQPQARILILTGIGAEAAVQQSLSAGVEGYILKNVSPDVLCAAIRAVRDEGGYLHPAVAQLVSHQKIEPTAGYSTPETAQQRLGLTPREVEILQMMATSQTNRDIAEKLFISEETVRTHVKRILHKLDQPNRTQAVLYGLKAGLIWLE